MSGFLFMLKRSSLIQSRIGRKDDVILHSSGEKTVPGPMENIIGQNPWSVICPQHDLLNKNSHG